MTTKANRPTPPELAALLVDRCPTLFVAMDSTGTIVMANAATRRALPSAFEGEIFVNTLEAASRRQFLVTDPVKTCGPDGTRIDLAHDGPRPSSITWHFFRVDRRYVGGLGIEVPGSSELTAEVEALRRQYHESLSQLAALTGRLREAAMIDSLTGVLNRRAVLEHADNAWTQHKQGSGPLACVMIDLDNFKQINDTFGHGAGDDVLQHLSALLRASLELTDIPGRLGGDEFIVFMPGTTLDVATKRCSALLSRVWDAPIAIAKANIALTLSIGVACSTEVASLTELRKRADDALYTSKQNGRNRVTAFGSAPLRE